MPTTRREFLMSAGCGLGALFLPGLPRLAHGQGVADRTLVVLFLRGGADGLHLIVPRGDETNYEALRNNGTVDIALPADSALSLDGFFELHPALAPLLPRFNAGEAAFMHACGGTGDYSHFEAQDAMERAETVAPETVLDGWLHRTLGVLGDLGDLNPAAPALAGIGIGGRVTKSLAGPDVSNHIAFPSLASFNLSGDFGSESESTLRSLYQNASNPLLGGAGVGALDTLSALTGIASQPPGATYPSGSGSLNRALQDAARLVKNPSLGARVVTIDFGGWDSHSNQLNQINNSAGRIATALNAFLDDIGPAFAAQTCVLVMTEFGRTARVNGGAGTDHGWGTVMMALGGGITGGRVLTRADPSAPGTGLATPDGHWPGLGPGELHVQQSSGNERDLKATTDYRDVFGDVLQNFFGIPADRIRDDVLRGYTPNPPGLFV